MSSPFPPLDSGRFVIAGCLGVWALALTSCVTQKLEPDFATFSQAYADNMNWQMLLNLARLDQGHPAYFMAIGEIRLGRNYTNGLQGTGTSTRTVAGTFGNTVTRTITNVLGGTVTPSVSASVSPSFLFIPINSEEATQQLISPISIDSFNALYQQGWPVDQLLRVLVERIEVDIVSDPRTARPDRIVLTNSPTKADPDSYQRFLRTCEVIRALQKAGGLSLLSEKIPGAGKSEEKIFVEEQLPRTSASSPGRVAPSGRGTASGKGDNQKVEHEMSYRFNVNQTISDRVFAQFYAEAPYQKMELDNLKNVFQRSNLAVGSTHQPGNSEHATKAVLVLRSFRNILDAAAKEQRAFDELSRQPGFLEGIPPRQRQPVLRTDWSVIHRPLLRPLSELTYSGSRYQITDLANKSEADLDSRWNRDVFRLLLDLSFQVTIDISKFQRNVLELSQ